MILNKFEKIETELLNDIIISTEFDLEKLKNYLTELNKPVC
jgi:hypothetical protein